MATSKHIVGSYEQVSFPEFPAIGELWAKVDTGADTGAIHCTKIEEKETDNGHTLEFSPFDHPELTIVTDKFHVNSVRSSNGEANERYFIETKIVVQGSEYPITLSLADRSEMKSQMLIGKRFLDEQNFLVDVQKNPTVS